VVEVLAGYGPLPFAERAPDREAAGGGLDRGQDDAAGQRRDRQGEGRGPQGQALLEQVQRARLDPQ
jgi:hypothetical protein